VRPREQLQLFDFEALKPPLKWVGGKRWLVPLLRPIWWPHQTRRMVEPFAGGIGVSLGLQPERALLNDINPYLISFYRWIQRGLVIDIPMENNEWLYYKHRDRFNELIASGEHDTAEVAGLFYYLNRAGYGGLSRFNANGGFNPPYGFQRTKFFRREFSEYQQAIARWEFTSMDFGELPLEPEDFLYADPPYDDVFAQYTPGGFSWEDQVRTAEWLARHQGPVVLSNSDTPRIIDLYERLGFKVDYIDARRSISGQGDRTPAREVLATRNL
jgi:DNA adenine methylase